MSFYTPWRWDDGKTPFHPHEIISYDSEFIRKTYYQPKLALMQLHQPSDRAARLYDPLDDDNVMPWKMLFTHAQPIVFHSGRQDLELMQLYGGGLPQSIRDTQIGFALLRPQTMIGYADLAAYFLDVVPEKKETCSDWLARPLTAAQMAYAADDVGLLSEIYPLMSAKLSALGRLSWWEEECETMLQRWRRPTLPFAWFHIRGAKTMLRTPMQMKAAAILTAVREKIAKQDNILRRHIMSDEELVQVARKAPRSVEELADYIPPAHPLWHELPFIMDCYEAMPADIPVFPEADEHSIMMKPPQKRQYKKWRSACASVAADLNISMHILLSSHDDLKRWCVKPTEDNPLLQGWRRPFFQEILR